jgi:hypothetical protein
MNYQKPENNLFNINTFHETAMNLVENFCSVICRPVELILRPWHGTRYFPVPVIFLSTALMLFLPLFSAVTSGLFSIVPFMRVPQPVGVFGIGSLSKLYFLLTFVHSIRLYRRMFNLASEQYSPFEGPPLPFFYLLPKGGSFWFCRIVLEPVVLFIVAKVLESFFIFQSGLTTYCEFAAICLAMKSFISWYRAWEYMRIILDNKFAAPIIMRAAEDKATDEEMASIHMASFPRNLSPEMRAETAQRVARDFEMQP